MSEDTLNEKTTVTAKCPKCKKRKTYTMPISFTPYCDKCLFVPMIPVSVKVRKIIHNPTIINQ